MNFIKIFLIVLSLTFVLLVILFTILLVHSKRVSKDQAVSKVINKSTRFKPEYIHIRAMYDDAVSYALTQLKNVKREDIRELDDCTIYLHQDNKTIEIYLSTYLGAPIVVMAHLNNDGYVLLFKSALFVNARIN